LIIRAFFIGTGRWAAFDAYVQIMMDSNKAITAVFSEITADLTGNVSITHNWPASVLEETKVSGDNLSAPKSDDISGSNFAKYKSGQMIIRFHAVTTQAQRASVFQSLDLKILDEIEYLNAYVVKTPGEDIYSYISAAQSLPAVAYAEPNHIATALSTTPNDPHYSLQWHYPQIRLPQAWNVTRGEDWVRIAVLDTGVDIGHPDLGANVDSGSGYNFVDGNNDFNDNHGHGTHVAGTIGADTDNNEGVAGVMWNCSIIPVKVLNDGGSGTYSGIAQGILYAAGLTNNPSISEPAHIINLSLGGKNFNQTLKDAVESAAEAGVIIVAATGNDNSSIVYPAKFNEVIAVGAVDFNYPEAPERAFYSNYGLEIDLVAPGGDLNVDTNLDGNNDGVLSTAFPRGVKDYGYGFLHGTSMATPHVSGVIGLMLSRGIFAEDVRGILHRTSMDLGDEGFNEEYGNGLINAYWAVNDVQKINILVGSREGNTIASVAERKIPLDNSTFSITGIPLGEHRVYAWIDVLGNGKIDPGDYLVETEKINFSEEKTYSVNLVLEEKK